MTSATVYPDLSEIIPSTTFQITFCEGQISADIPPWLSDALGLTEFSSLADSSDSEVVQSDLSPMDHKDQQDRIRKEEQQVDMALADHEEALHNIQSSLIVAIHSDSSIRGEVCRVGYIIGDAGTLYKIPSQRDTLRSKVMAEARNLASLKSFLFKEQLALRASAEALIKQHNTPPAEQSTSQDQRLKELLGNLTELAIAVESNWRKASDREQAQNGKGFSLLPYPEPLIYRFEYFLCHNFRVAVGKHRRSHAPKGIYPILAWRWRVTDSPSRRQEAFAQARSIELSAESFERRFIRFDLKERGLEGARSSKPRRTDCGLTSDS
ncbi:hypothetical protein FFLO_06356 [Filobasidium floriforme]|uniref:Uncharacterized protein n=1 Tax=Filobasidium floriforme TaxID=5210 RepID=A0A8K0JFC1_9TREE|nr:uncharacterized protein HD553DRAFT_335111 [Filobasidium floriforme]KAG7528185.1 hypothetical protein FFLO_06356 [Filobasidium floriforme]KAH8085904.1 hypothetical protein HD553DRAFT_335111 [Filobasidium floriforme]